MSSNNPAAVLRLIEEKQLSKPYILAIDGRCASGKTTLAAKLSERLGFAVVHMDDFYLPFSLRTPERMAEAGGNMDFDRLINEILKPFSAGENAVYRPYACHENRFLSPINLNFSSSIILEGSYSCHPKIRSFSAIKIFMDISAKKQLERIAVRDPGHVDAYRSTWIPREEYYFESCSVRDICDTILVN